MSKRKADPMLIRDCYAQVRTARRVLALLLDDLGDVTAITDSPELSVMCDQIEAFDRQLETMRDRLEALSRGTP